MLFLLFLFSKFEDIIFIPFNPTIILFFGFSKLISSKISLISKIFFLFLSISKIGKLYSIFLFNLICLIFKFLINPSSAISVSSLS